jgi:phospholipase C
VRPLLVAAAASLALTGCAGSSAALRSPGANAAAAPANHPCGRTAQASYRHVVWIWMENRSYSSVLGNSGQAPGLAAYAKQCGVATNYHAVAHPSLPNYVAAVAGGTHGITSDCDPGTCPVRHNSLFAQVTRAGGEWRSYAESMSTPCDHRSYGRYAARHNPAVYFPPIARQCGSHDVALGAANGPFAHQLASNQLPGFTFVTPNLCDDGHDCSTRIADNWLSGWLGRIVASPAYRAGRTVVFVTWDEGDGSANRVATVVIGPSVAPGTRVGQRFSHYSLLRTTEEILGLPKLGHAATASSMRSSFGL